MSVAMPVDGQRRRGHALRELREPVRIPRASVRDPRRRDRSARARARARARERCPVPARVDERGLRRAAGSTRRSRRTGATSTRSGPRAVYDEAKRFAETLTMTYHRELGVDVGIVRIFNTYGPRLRPADGRVVSNFLVQAMEGRPLTIYGDGSQTRSYCYRRRRGAGHPRAARFGHRRAGQHRQPR